MARRARWEAKEWMAARERLHGVVAYVGACSGGSDSLHCRLKAPPPDHVN